MDYPAATGSLPHVRLIKNEDAEIVGREGQQVRTVIRDVHDKTHTGRYECDGEKAGERITEQSHCQAPRAEGGDCPTQQTYRQSGAR